MSPYFVEEEGGEKFRDGHLKLKHNDLKQKAKNFKVPNGKEWKLFLNYLILEYRKVYNIIWKIDVILSFNFLVPILLNRHFEFYLFSL